MHTLITDAIETCGGSSRLQKLLNRLGACASIDTHSRYVQYRVQKRMEEGPMASYPSCSFMIISADIWTLNTALLEYIVVSKSSPVGMGLQFR